MNYTVDQLGQAVKMKYPGSYDHLSDTEVGTAFLSKHPEYQQVVSSGPGGQGVTARTAAGEQPQEKKSVGDFIGNIFKSGADLVKNTVQAVVHPVKTVHTLADTALGTAEKLVPGRQGAETEADALGNFFKERYGGWENVKNTAYNDPVGFLLDAATLLGGSGAVLKGAGTLGKVSSLVKAGEVASAASRVIDPLNAAGKAAGAAGKLAEKAVGATTGVGSDTIRVGLESAAEGGAKAKAFRAGMRGEISGQELLGQAKDALQNMKNTKNLDYRTSLAKIKESAQVLDLKPVHAKLQEMLDNFGVQVLKDETTGQPVLSFSRSTIADPAEQGRVQRIFDDVTKWNDATPAGIDTLKRRIENEFSVHSDVRAFVQGVKSETLGLLKKNVPGYEEMTRAYHQASDMIDDIQKSLSLGDKASVETGIKKLTSALKQNNEMRQAFLQELEKAGGKELTSEIAGSAMSSVTPRGIVNPLLAAGGLTFAHMTQFLPALLLASPRVVGEFINALGYAKASGMVGRAKDVIRGAYYGETLGNRQSDSQ